MADGVALELEGQRYWRVSAVLSAFKFEDDPAEATVAVRDGAARTGSWLHRRIEKAVNGAKLPKLTSAEQTCLWEAFEAYRRDYGLPEPIWQERRIWRPGPPRLTGALDWLDAAMVIDWKTSQRLLLRHRIQANAYAAMAAEELGLAVLPAVRLVQLSKNTGDYAVRTWPFSKELWAWFLRMADVFADMKAVEEAGGIAVAVN